MKKILLSSFLILIFAGYVIFQRTSAENAYAVSPIATEIKKSGLASGSSSGAFSTPQNSNGGAQIVNGNKQSSSISESQSSASSEPPSSTTQAPNKNSQNTLKDGGYTGTAADAYYGNVQIKAIIQDGKITGVQFLDYPSDRKNSVRINTRAMPLLKAEAIQAQNAYVDIVSGATYTSQAFQESLADALAQAKN